MTNEKIIDGLWLFVIFQSIVIGLYGSLVLIKVISPLF
jgi:hypothetical protein